MALDNALFLVDRGGTNYRSKGSDIGDRMKSGDRVLVQRGTNHFKATYDGSGWDKIRDSDLLLAWDGTNNRKVTGENFKALFGRTCYLQEFQQQDYRNGQFPPLNKFVADDSYYGLYFNINSPFAKSLSVGQQIDVEDKNSQQRYLITVIQKYSQTNSGGSRWIVKFDESSFPFSTYTNKSWIFNSCPRSTRFTWNWRGHSNNANDTLMCGNTNPLSGTAIFWRGMYENLFSDIDANGEATAWHIYYDNQNSKRYNDRELWLKFGNNPAVKINTDPGLRDNNSCTFTWSNAGQPYSEGGIKVTYHNYNPDYCRKETYAQNGGGNCPPAGKIKMAWQNEQSRTVIRVPGADWANVLEDGGYIWLNNNPYKITSPVQNECGGDPDYTRIYIQERVEGNTETAGTMWTVTNCPP